MQGTDFLDLLRIFNVLVYDYDCITQPISNGLKNINK